MSHESMTYDVVIVGGGPAGLSAAIELLKCSQKNQYPLRVCLLEKGSQIGAHILSGAVLNPKTLKQLLPEDWQNAPLETPVTEDRFYYLTQNHALRLPTPKSMKNAADHHIISLGELSAFLAKQAEALGCEIYSGFAATDILYNDHGEMIGIITGEFGLDRHGEKKPQYQPGLAIYAKQTLIAEGCRGQLSEKLIQRYQLRADCSPQTYGLGIKEVWTVPKAQHCPGRVIHTVGWPLPNNTYGGSFIYHLSKQRVALGLVVGLDYSNPWLSPFDEMQQFKTHPLIRSLLKGGERIGYGARALNEGGFQSIPKLTFPGGMLIGDSAGFLNVAQIKGIHMAIESGQLAAQACFEFLKNNEQDQGKEVFAYSKSFQTSWAAKELYQVRNIRPGFHWGLWPGILNAAFEIYLSAGRSPWTFKYKADHIQLKLAQKSKKIHYPKADGQLTFDKPSSVFLSNIFHNENQPCHLKLRNPEHAIDINYNQYASPETRYCPAGVYEITEQNQKKSLTIHAQNCIQCKTCDIKDPTQNIVWYAPEGGNGPNYIGM